MTISLVIASPIWSQSQPPGLSGTWRFDQSRSAEERKAESGNVAAGSGMIRDRTNLGRGSDLDRPSGAERVQPGAAARAGAGGMTGPLAAYGRPQQQLVIVQSDSTITISLPTGVTELYRLDGRKEKIEVPGAGLVETSARWKGGKLTIERNFGAPGAVREVYSLRGEGKELLVEVRLTGAEIAQPIDQKRVYGLAPKS